MQTMNEPAAVAIPTSWRSALSLLRDDATVMPIIQHALSHMSVYKETELYVQQVTTQTPEIWTPGLRLWVLVMAGYLGHAQVRFATPNIAHHVKELCRKAYWHMDMQPACMRILFNLPLPSPGPDQDDLLGERHILAPLTHVTQIRRVFDRAIRFLDDHMFVALDTSASRIAPTVCDTPSCVGADVLLFVIGIAAFIWHTEYNYGALKAQKMQHSYEAQDPFFKHAVYHGVMAKPPPFVYPEDTRATITLASIVANTTSASFTGSNDSENPCNMHGAMDTVRTRLVTWIWRCRGRLAIEG